MASKVHIYHMGASTPCRFVEMTAKRLGVDFEQHTINLDAGDNKTEEYLKINPHGTVPAMTCGSLVLNESSAIARYLVRKFGKGNDVSLYPFDNPELVAKVDQMLDYNNCSFYTALGSYYYPNILRKEPHPEQKLGNMKKHLCFLDDVLANSEYVSGEQLTLADLSLFSGVSFFQILGDLDLSPYPHIARWLALCRQQPHFKESETACYAWKKAIQA